MEGKVDRKMTRLEEINEIKDSIIETQGKHIKDLKELPSLKEVQINKLLTMLKLEALNKGE